MHTAKSSKQKYKKLQLQHSPYSNPPLNTYNQSRIVNYMEQSYEQSELNSQDEPEFQTKNYVFQLQSKYNNLQYEKTKNLIEYQNQISELKHQNIYLQNCAASISQDLQVAIEEREELRFVLGDVREQNHGLSKQISKLKQQLYGLQSRSVKQQLEPSHRRTQQLEQQRIEIAEKDDLINQLSSQLNSLKAIEKTPKNSQKIARIQLQNDQLKQNLRSKESQLKHLQLQLSDKQARYIDEKQKLILKLSEKQQKYEQQIFKNTLQIQKIQQQNQLKIKKMILIHNQQLRHLRQQKIIKKQAQTDEQNTALLSKMNQLNLQINKLKSNKTNLEEYIKYLEQNYSKDELKVKKIQEDAFLLEKQNSQLKTQLFNEKLNFKKIVNEFKLEYEEQRIKLSQIIEEKTKEVGKFKELTLSSNRRDIEYSQLQEKCNQNVEQFKKKNAETQELKNELRSLREKYDKKSDKFAQLQKQLRKQFQNRIKQLQNQLYKLQMSNSQYQLRLQSQNKPKNNKKEVQMFGFNNQDDEDDEQEEEMPRRQQKQYVVLPMRSEQRQQELKNLRMKYLQKQQLCTYQQQKIGRLQQQLKQSKQFQYRLNISRQDKTNKFQAITELEQQNMRLNKQIKRQRSANEQLRKQVNQNEEKMKIGERKMRQDAKHLQMQCSHLNSQLLQAKQRSQYLYEEMRRVQAVCGQKEKVNKDLAKDMKQMQQSYNRQCKALLTRIQTLQKTIVDLKAYMDEDKSSKRSSSSSGMSKLQQQNYQLKIDYSQSLQQTNNLLLKYQQLQQKYKKLSSLTQTNTHLHNKDQGLTTRQSRAQRQLKQQMRLNNEHINKLNYILMQKQKEIKQLKNHNSYHKNEHKRTINSELWLATTRSTSNLLSNHQHQYSNQPTYPSNLFYKK